MSHLSHQDNAEPVVILTLLQTVTDRTSR